MFILNRINYIALQAIKMQDNDDLNFEESNARNKKKVCNISLKLSLIFEFI